MKIILDGPQMKKMKTRDVLFCFRNRQKVYIFHLYLSENHFNTSCGHATKWKSESSPGQAHRHCYQTLKHK